jgi:hypothetical protein
VAGWRQQQQQDPAALPARVEAAITSLEALLARMPLDDPKVRRLLPFFALVQCVACLRATYIDAQTVKGGHVATGNILPQAPR